MDHRILLQAVDQVEDPTDPLLEVGLAEDPIDRLQEEDLQEGHIRNQEEDPEERDSHRSFCPN